MYDDFWLNRWVVPLIFAGLLFYTQYFKKTFVSWAQKIQNENRRKYVQFLLDGLGIKLDNWKISILVPIFLPIILNLVVAFLFNAELHAMGEPFWFALITSGFLNPIAEEMIFRSFFLGSIIYIAERFVKSKRTKDIVYLVGLLFTSLIFLIGHNNVTPYQITARFSLSIIFGMLYLSNGRNLLPPIIAHASSNIFLILIDLFR